MEFSNMTRFRFFGPLLIAALFLFLPAALRAQAPDTEPSTDTTAATLVYEYSGDYDVAFKLVKKALESLDYKISYASKRRNMIETDFNVLVDAEEGGDFFEIMNQYGEVPYIRSPGWTIGRSMITVRFEEQPNEKILLQVFGQLSGYEARFTNQWHYWKSNGLIEEEAMNAIITTLEGSE